MLSIELIVWVQTKPAPDLVVASCSSIVTISSVPEFMSTASQEQPILRCPIIAHSGLRYHHCVILTWRARKVKVGLHLTTTVVLSTWCFNSYHISHVKGHGKLKKRHLCLFHRKSHSITYSYSSWSLYEYCSPGSEQMLAMHSGDDEMLGCSMCSSGTYSDTTNSLQCTWCSSVEFENITSFSCFYHTTQITRISLVSLTHTARKSPENQSSKRTLDCDENSNTNARTQVLRNPWPMLSSHRHLVFSECIRVSFQLDFVTKMQRKARLLWIWIKERFRSTNMLRTHRCLHG